MKDKELDLEILENADDSDIRRIAGNCPASESDKERMFAMSRKIYTERTKESNEAPAMVVSGVEIYKKPLWQKIVSAAAVIALVAGGAAGGLALLKNCIPHHLIAKVPLSKVTEKDKNNGTEEKSGKDSPLINSDYNADDHIKVYDPILNVERDVLVSNCFVNMEPFNQENIDVYSLVHCNAAKLSELFKDFEWKETNGEERFEHTSYNLISCDYNCNDTMSRLEVLFYDYGLVSVYDLSEYDSDPNMKFYDIGKENTEKVFDYVLAEYDLVKSNISPDKFIKLLDYSYVDIASTENDTSNLTKLDSADAQKLESAILSAQWTEYNKTVRDVYAENNRDTLTTRTMLFVNKFIDGGYEMDLYDYNMLECQFNGVKAVYKISDELNDTIKSIIDNATGASVSSVPAETVSIPPVADMQYELAKQQLRERGLNINTKKMADETVKPGYVIKSEPAAGEKIPKGSTVTLYVSSDSVDKVMEMYDFRGMNADDADVRAGYYGFNIHTTTVASAQKKGIIVAQSPLPGSGVAESKEVHFYISSGNASEGASDPVISIPDNASGKFNLDFIITRDNEDARILSGEEFSCPGTSEVNIPVEQFDDNSVVNVYITNSDTGVRALLISFYCEHIGDKNVISRISSDDISEVFGFLIGN